MSRVWALAALAATATAWAAWMTVVGGDDVERRSSAAEGVRVTSAREFWDAYRRAGERRSQGQWQEAIQLYTRTLELRPDHEDSLYYLGNCHVERGERAQAIAAYQRLVEVNPDGSSRGYMQMGLLRASVGADGRRELDGAERLFRRALEVDSDSGALLGLAEVALLKRRWSEAARMLDEVNADNAMSVAAPYLLAYLSFRRGDRPAAWRLFQTAVARGELKKAPVAWSEEGDVKADPALRWRALARQSVFGEQWIQVRRYRQSPGPSVVDMERELTAFGALLDR